MGKYNRTYDNPANRLYHLNQTEPDHRNGKEMFDWSRDRINGSSQERRQYSSWACRTSFTN